jgi:TIR domain-containing protein
MAKGARRHGVFVSYCHKDAKWLDRLKVHLDPYVRRGDLNLWDDTKIDPGDLWRPAIKGAIDDAAAAVLLVSADFLASQFIVTEELPRLLDRAEKGGARILSIIVRPCSLDAHPRIAGYQALNGPKRPLSDMKSSKAEGILADAAEQVARLLGRSASATDAHTTSGVSEESDDRLFEEMRAAAITLAVLEALARPGVESQAYTIGDLTRVLNLSSRRLGFQAVERLFAAGWIEKQRVDKVNTKF